MRTLLFLTATSLVAAAFGQGSTQTDPAKPYERLEVVMVDSSMKAEQVYSIAKRWFVDSFRDAGEVIQLDDPAEKIIMGKGSGTVNWTMKGFGGGTKAMAYSFSIEVQAKAGRYRVKLYDFLMEGKSIQDIPCCYGKCDGAGKGFRDAGLQMCTDIFTRMDQLLLSLSQAMKSPGSSDW